MSIEAQTREGYLLVVVVLSAIKKTAASFDGVDDLVGSSVDIHFPSTISFPPKKVRTIQSQLGALERQWV